MSNGTKQRKFPHARVIRTAAFGQGFKDQRAGHWDTTAADATHGVLGMCARHLYQAGRLLAASTPAVLCLKIGTTVTPDAVLAYVEMLRSGDMPPKFV